MGFAWIEIGETVCSSKWINVASTRAKPREMLKDVLLVIIGLIGGLFIQQSAEQLLTTAPLWISIPLSVGGVGGFTLLFVSGARWLMNGRTPLPADNVDDDD